MEFSDGLRKRAAAEYMAAARAVSVEAPFGGYSLTKKETSSDSIGGPAATAAAAAAA